MPTGSARATVRPAHVAAVLLVYLSLALVDWKSSLEQRAVRALPTAVRQQLFEHALLTVQVLCFGRADAAFAPRCRSEAAFVEMFPECDDACRARVRRL
ncbi:MAG: hypothetical protein ACK4N5_25285, partial [Myxococcales bacterium]